MLLSTLCSPHSKSDDLVLKLPFEPRKNTTNITFDVQNLLMNAALPMWYKYHEFSPNWILNYLSPRCYCDRGKQTAQSWEQTIYILQLWMIAVYGLKRLSTAFFLITTLDKFFIDYNLVPKSVLFPELFFFFGGGVWLSGLSFYSCHWRLTELGLALTELSHVCWPLSQALNP